MRTNHSGQADRLAWTRQWPVILSRIGWSVAVMAGTLCSSWSLAEPSSSDLTSLSLEELMQIEVTSVSKKEQTLFEVPAAVYVITGEDIKRSGATSIPEALRMAPGLEVARIDGNKWAVSSRGFNERFANKLLVLIDGRSVYTPLFSGIFWEDQDVVLEDVDRIEIIRGPGAAMWGANAVNGIINLITKPGAATQGELLIVGTGSEESALATFRHGAQFGRTGHYRAYAKLLRRDALELSSGAEAADGSERWQVGFRSDWKASDTDSITVQGDYHDGEVGQTYTLIETPAPPFTRTFDFDTGLSGGNVLARWTRRYSGSSEFALQVYYDNSKRDDAFGTYERGNVDIDFHRRQHLGQRHDVVWGLGYRRSTDDVDGGFVVSASPSARTDDLFNVFVHDEIAVTPNRLKVILGAKLEKNDYTDYEFAPNVRVLWRASDRHSVWAAISRAVRTPSRAEHDIRFILDALPPDTLFPGAPPTLIVFEQNRDFASEELTAYEAGYRFTVPGSVSVDLAGFYNDYESLRSMEPGIPFPEISPPPPHLVAPVQPDNQLGGTTYGLELAADWRPFQRWRLHASYASLRMDLELEPTSMDTQSLSAEGRSPREQWRFRSFLDLDHGMTFDVLIRGVGELPSLGVTRYEGVDARLAWSSAGGVELAVVGKNLTDNDQIEFVSPFLNTASTVARRSVYGTLTWKF